MSESSYAKVLQIKQFNANLNKLKPIGVLSNTKSITNNHFPGNFQPGEEGCILKKYVEREAECLSGLTSDPKLQEFSPTFHGVVDVNGEKYTRMQDLLLPFDCPSLMDCKMGIR